MMENNFVMDNMMQTNEDMEIASDSTTRNCMETESLRDTDDSHSDFDTTYNTLFYITLLHHMMSHISNYNLQI